MKIFCRNIISQERRSLANVSILKDVLLMLIKKTVTYSYFVCIFLNVVSVTLVPEWVLNMEILRYRTDPTDVVALHLLFQSRAATAVNIEMLRFIKRIFTC